MVQNATPEKVVVKAIDFDTYRNDDDTEIRLHVFEPGRADAPVVLELSKRKAAELARALTDELADDRFLDGLIERVFLSETDEAVSAK